MADSTATTFNISRELVKSWRPCTDGYRWFLGKFPQGGAYTAVHAALREDNLFSDAGWLFNNALAYALRNAPGVTADLAAGQSDEAAKLIEATSPAEPKVPSSDDVKVTTENDNGDDGARIGSSGNGARIGSSGYGARIGSSGYGAQIGSSGYGARIGSSGYGARIGSSGNDAQIGSSGNGARIGSSGNGARINATGERAAIACVGIGAHGKAGKDGALALAYWDESADRPRFAVGYVGENIEADTWYSVNGDGEFVKEEVA